MPLKILLKIALTFLVLATSPLFPESANEIIDHIDKLFRSDSSHGKVTMTIFTPSWKRTLTLEAWTKTLDDTFIVIETPIKDAGITTLRIKTEMWNYFPKIDKVVKVPPSMMMGAWMGSDFTNDDLVHEVSLVKDYTPAFIAETAPEGHKWISLKPNKNIPTVWGEIRLLVRLNDLMPIEELYFDEHGQKVRRLTFAEFKVMGGKKIPTYLEMTPLYKTDHKTSLRYQSMAFDISLPEDTFTLRNLKRKR